MRMTEKAPVLEVRDLRVEFPAPRGAAGAPAGAPAVAVDGLSFSLAPGEGLAVLGESGSGKTVSALAIAGLLPAGARSSGSVRLAGRELLNLSERALSGVRGGAIGFVFQEPAGALNPVLRVGEQLEEAALVHGKIPMAARNNALAALRSAEVPDAEARARAFPHELSGGLRQRACIAMAVVNRPQLLIADEPTSALDVSVQAGILELFAELRRAFDVALVFITHDVHLAPRVADRALVLYAGRMVELGPAAELAARPMHPYTRALLAAAPRLGGGKCRLPEIPGQLPAADEVLPGCRFAPRCELAAEVCRRRRPELAEVLAGRWVACWRLGAHPAAGRLPEIPL